MNRKYTVIGILAVTVIPAIFACGSSATPQPTPLVPVSLNDPRCTQPGSIGDASIDFTDEVILVDYRPGPVLSPSQLTVVPLPPPTLEFDITMDGVSTFTSCFSTESSAEVRLIGTNYMPKDLILRTTITLPDGLHIESEGLLARLPDGRWEGEARISALDGSPSELNPLVGFLVSGDIPGRYKIRMDREWFEAKSSGPPDGSEGFRDFRVLTLFAVALE